MHTYLNLGTQPFSRTTFARKASLALGVFALLSTTFMVQTASAQINHTSNPQQRLSGGSKSDRSSSGYKRVQRPTARSTSSHRTTSHDSSSRGTSTHRSSHGTSSRGTSSRGTSSSRHNDRSTHRREQRREGTSHRRDDRSHRRSDRNHRRESTNRTNRHYRHDNNRNNRNNNNNRRHNNRHSNNSYFDFSFNNRYNRRHNRHNTGYYTNYRSRLGINFFFGNTGYSSYRWASSPYSFYRPGQSSYSHYRTNTQCERVIIEANHQGHAELISVKECYNPYDGYYIIQGSERIIDCRDNGYRRPTYY